MRSVALLILLGACSLPEVAPEGPPGPRGVIHGASAYDPMRNRLVVYGGLALTSDGEQLPTANTYEWDGTTWERRLIEGPGPLAEHAMAYDEHRHLIVLYGGLGGARTCERTWEYDGERWSETGLETSARCRWRHTMTYDPDLRSVVLFGGISEDGCTEGHCQETWAFDGAIWALVTRPPR